MLLAEAGAPEKEDSHHGVEECYEERLLEMLVTTSRQHLHRHTGRNPKHQTSCQHAHAHGSLLGLARQPSGELIHSSSHWQFGEVKKAEDEPKRLMRRKPEPTENHDLRNIEDTLIETRRDKN